MVLCEKGCFNRYGQNPGSKLAYYVRTEKLLYCDGPLTPLSLGQSATQGTQYFYVFVFTGRYVEVFTACDGGNGRWVRARAVTTLMFTSRASVVTGARVTIRWADGGDTGLMIMITLRTDDGMTR